MQGIMLSSWLALLLTANFMAADSKLNVPRILLPYNSGIPTNYTLEAESPNRCYKWTVSRYDLISVTPLPSKGESDTCTTKAVVSSISRYPKKENAIVMAEDERTGQFLRCDVIIDAIHSIEIFTTTRVLFLEDAPEVFEVVAKNEEGNKFSSLNGLTFQWTLEGYRYPSDVHGVVRFLKFLDSEYEIPPGIDFWEQQNMHGSMVLMEGSKTGSAKVAVRLADRLYQDVEPHEVSLVIVANLNLIPSVIYLLPGTEAKYKLELLKQGRAYHVPLPSDQYYLKVEDTNISSLDPSTSTVLAKNYGSTNIIVKDEYISAEESAYLPSSVIHVTDAHYMVLSVKPGDKFDLEEDQTYFITVNIYERNGHPILITEETFVELQFPKEHFKVLSSVENGTYHQVFTLQPGVCQITAVLSGIRKKDGTFIKATNCVPRNQDVTIYEKIKIHPGVTLLPWDPVIKPTYLINLTATGGTNSYKWTSSKPHQATVLTSYGSKQTQVKTIGQGETKIHVTDSHFTLFTGSALVSVQSVIEIKLFPRQVEIHKGDVLEVPLAMYGYLRPDHTEKTLFHDCSQIPLKVDADETLKFEYLDDGATSDTANSCRNIHLRCISEGYNRIQVRYGQGGALLRDVVIVACFNKLTTVYPSTDVVLSLGTSTAVVFEGGPRPWVICRGNHFANLSVDNSIVDASLTKSAKDTTGSTFVHQALCKEYGEANIELSVGNKPCKTNLHPLHNKATAKVACAMPNALIIKPVIMTVTDKKCPSLSDDKASLHNGQDILLKLIVKDSLGRTFHNISSLDVHWSVSDKALATLESTDGFQTEYTMHADYMVVKKNYQVLHTHKVEGMLKVTATITGYKAELLQAHGINAKQDFFEPISRSLNIHLVEEVELSPKKISVFNNPANKGYLSVYKGSGHFYVEASDPKKATVFYNETSRQIEIEPLDSGSFTISVIDLCMPMKQEAISHVHIYGIAAVSVDVLDKVELGKSIVAAVEVKNEDMQSIPSAVFSLMNLQPVVSSNEISVRISSKVSPDRNRALYNINGLALGHASVKFVTSYSVLKDQQYESDSYSIQVFPPLRLSPNNITLVMGAAFQVVCVGGPRPESRIEYSIEDSAKATVSTDGLVEAKKLGETVLIASSVGYRNGEKVVYSNDTAVIHVIVLRKIRIHSPITTMITGSEMPVYAVGLTEDETPFMFGSASSNIEFSWSVSNQQVATVNGVLKHAGLQELEEHNLCVRVKALEEGHSKLRLEVRVKDHDSGLVTQYLSDEKLIRVFQQLEAETRSGFVKDVVILMSPNSEMKLRFNRFLHTNFTYSLSEGYKSVVSVNSQGVLRSSEKLGKDTLKVIAEQEFANTQSMIITVEVAEVKYMMVNPVTKIKTSNWQRLSHVPVGYSMLFVATHHDEHGRMFDAVRSKIEFRPNRMDLSQISWPKNDTLSIKLSKVGSTIVKVWDSESPSISPDYVKVSAGIVIDPADIEVVSGDIVCFGSSLVGQEGQSGVWTSDGYVISVHSSSGGAVALSPGEATILYTISGEYVTSAKVNILPVEEIRVFSGNLKYVTNVPRQKPYKIRVLLTSSKVDHVLNRAFGKNCTTTSEDLLLLPHFEIPFVCEVTFNESVSDVKASDVFQVESGYDLSDGLYYCNIVAKNNVFPVEISALESHLIVSISLQVEARGLDFVAEQVSFQFLPAFVLNEENIVLGSHRSSVTFSITASLSVQQCLEVRVSDKNLLSVSEPIRRDSSLIFQVRLNEVEHYHPDDLKSLHIHISCLKTNQEERLPVHLKVPPYALERGNARGQQHVSPYSEAWQMFLHSGDWSHMLTCVMASLVIFIVLVIRSSWGSSRGGTVTTQPVFLDSPNAGSFVHTPSRMSPSSPGTPRNLGYSPSSSIPYEGYMRPVVSPWNSPEKQLLARRRQ